MKKAQDQRVDEVMEWMQTCTGEEFMRVGVFVLTSLSTPEAIRDALGAIVKRVKREADDSAPLTKAYMFVFGDPDIYDAIGRPTEFAKVSKVIEKKLGMWESHKRGSEK